MIVLKVSREISLPPGDTQLNWNFYLILYFLVSFPCCKREYPIKYNNILHRNSTNKLILEEFLLQLCTEKLLRNRKGLSESQRCFSSGEIYDPWWKIDAESFFRCKLTSHLILYLKFEYLSIDSRKTIWFFKF